MEQLNLSIKQALIVFQKKNFITEGVEGKLYHIPGVPDILLKAYHNFQVPLYFKEKLEAFHNLEEFDDIIARPLHLVTMNDIPVGYTMKEFGISLDQVKVSFAERVNILNQCKDIILKLHQKDIILGDIKLQNFLYKDGKVKVCDICNAKVGKYDVTVKNSITKFHEKRRHNVDEYTDIQAFNYMTYLYLKYGMTDIKKKNLINGFNKLLQQDMEVHGTPNYYDEEATKIIKNIYECHTIGSNEILLDHIIKSR